MEVASVPTLVSTPFFNLPKIIDIFTYNGEYDLLDLRLNILRPYVDRFVAVQAPTTFTARPKPIYELPQEVESFVIDENYPPEEIELAERSPNTQGADHWKREFLQKESIKKALIGLEDNDLVFIGDVDEIWEWPPFAFQEFVAKLKLRVYAYYLDNRSSEEFWGTIVAPYGIIKDKCLNHLRAKDHIKTDSYLGWHFTSMGGVEKVRQKLDDQYTEESYNTREVQEALKRNIEEKKDFLGRNFTYQTDENDWPQYLKEHRNEYRHLCNAMKK